MAQIKGLAVRLLIIAIIITTARFFSITTISYAFTTDDQNDQPCLPPVEYASYNYGCNKESLSSSQVQQSVLSSITKEFAIRFPGGRAGVCYEDFYNDRDDHLLSTAKSGGRVKIFSYASCSVGYIGIECYQCILEASRTIQYHCLGRVGAQASSEICCVRYEKYNFIKNLKHC